ncbi:MAG: M23 family metallopeptidase [Deltaproteobacteria bacterium]|nr:M23 family metallopeptidase [Deltaproteobacteria bacterium]
MALRKFTIVLLPDGARKVRQLKIPKFLISIIFILILAAIAFQGWVISDYKKIKAMLPELAQKENENKQLKTQLASLAHKFDEVNTRMAEYKKFDDKLRVMVDLEPDENNFQFLGIGGSDPALLDPKYTVEKAHRKLVRLMHQSLDNLDTEISLQTQKKSELYSFLEERKSMLSCTPSIWPTKGWITSNFGNRISPFTDQKEFHSGLDISARTGSPIIAPADGIVDSIGSTYGFGKTIIIKHGYGHKTKYAHLSEYLVKKGEKVKRGQHIGLVGSSGRTTGPHLHYEVHVKDVPVDPLRYILN